MSSFSGISAGINVLLSIHGETCTYHNSTKTLIINRREGSTKLPSLDGTSVDTELLSVVMAPISTFSVPPIIGEVITDSMGWMHRISKVIRHPTHYEIRCIINNEEE